MNAAVQRAAREPQSPVSAAAAKLNAEREKLRAASELRDAEVQRRPDLKRSLDDASLALVSGGSETEFQGASQALAALDARVAALDTVAIPALEEAAQRAEEELAAAQDAADLDAARAAYGSIIKPLDETCLRLITELDDACEQAREARAEVRTEFPRATLDRVGLYEPDLFLRAVPPRLRQFLRPLFPPPPPGPYSSEAGDPTRVWRAAPTFAPDVVRAAINRFEEDSE